MNMKTWMGLFAAAALSLQPIWAQAPPPPEGQAVPAPAPGKPETAVQVNVSPAAAEVVRLAESGLGDEVVASYVTSSQAAFNLTADDIVYLKDVGISEAIISQMMAHDRQIRESGPPPVSSQTPVPAPAPPANEVATPPNAPPPDYVSNPPAEVNYFYSDLAPYGTWLEVDGIGWCWQPRCVVVNRAWQPYCDYGHWVYTDCGWYWQSTYSWGWAPFHYGRWQLAHCGWVWAPDRVWGPAWVTWRVAGDRCGWAPLPPFTVVDVHGGWLFRGAHVSVNFDFGLRPDHFAFVAFHDFGERNVWSHRLPRTEVTRIYNHTTIINNYTVNRNTVVNHGVSFDRVSAESHARIQRASIRDVPADRSPPRGGTDRANVVYRHELPATPRPAPRVVAERVDANRTVVQHTPIVATRTDTRPGAPRYGQGANANVSRGNGDVPRGMRLGNANNRPSSAGPANTPNERGSANTRQGSARDTISSPRNTERGPVTPPVTTDRSAPRSAERAPITPPAADRSVPSRSTPAERDSTPRREATPVPRAAERAPVTPPSVPREYQSTPRSSRAEGERAPAAPSREYQQVPRSPRVYGDQPSRSTGPESRGSSPQYYPKGYQQPSETRSAPRGESRQSSPSYSAPSRSSDDGRSGGKRDRDR